MFSLLYGPTITSVYFDIKNMPAEKGTRQMCRTCFAHRREWKFITFVKWQNQEGPWDTLHWAACWLFTFLPSCDAEEVFITIRGLFKQTLGDGEGQESLECCSPWFCRIVHDLATEHYPSQHLHLNKPLSQLWQNAAENSQPVFSCGPPPLDLQVCPVNPR